MSDSRSKSAKMNDLGEALDKFDYPTAFSQWWDGLSNTQKIGWVLWFLAVISFAIAYIMYYDSTTTTTMECFRFGEPVDCYGGYLS